jgi:putative transposase
MQGFKSFRQAKIISLGIELVRMIRKGQLHHRASDEVSTTEKG